MGHLLGRFKHRTIPEIQDHETGKSLLRVADDSRYVAQLQEVLQEGEGLLVMNGPTQLLDHLFIGNNMDATNVDKLRALNVTHVMNCAGTSKNSMSKSFYEEEDCCVTDYMKIDAYDRDSYEIMKHMKDAHEFIEDAKYRHGNVLVHCAMGINRSGAICIGYLMIQERMRLLDAVRYLKQRRGLVLSNPGFQKQLIHFARKHNLL